MTDRSREHRPSTEQAFFERRMARLSPLPETFGGVELPRVTVPSLDGLVVTAPAPAPISAEDLTAFVAELARERAHRTPRKYGEPVRLGDEVIVDMLGYANGRLLPFSARRGLVVEPGSGRVLPWLDEALLECAVGDGLELPVTFPEDEPAEELRGVEATYLIDVVGAAAVDLPDPDSPEYLRLLSDKDSIDAAMEEVAEMLEDERIGEAWEEARERVIDEVIRRAEMTLPPALIDEEIRRAWQRVEEPFLTSKGFDDEEKREALDGWLDDAETRIEAERRLRLTVILRAIIARDQLRFDEQTLALLAAQSESRFHLEKQQLKEALADPSTHASLVNVGLHLRALQVILDVATVRFEGVEGVHRFTPRSGPLPGVE